jgi:hypothetical protein
MTTNRNANSWFQTSERFFNALRKTSFVHRSIIKYFEKDIKEISSKIEALISEANQEKLFELRTLVFKLEDIVDIKIIEKYNSCLNKEEKDFNKDFTVSKNDLAINESSNINQEGVKTPIDVWSSVVSYLKSKLNVHTYNVWVKPLEYKDFKDGNIEISVQNYFYKNWLEDHCSSLIKEHLKELDLDYKVSFVTK